MRSVMSKVLDKPLVLAEPWWFVSGFRNKWRHADRWPFAGMAFNIDGLFIGGRVWYGLTTLAGPLVLEEL